MIKFLVVVYRREELTRAEFRRHLEWVHGPLARKLPGLKKYVQNYVSEDAKRKHPGWDAIVELWFRGPGCHGGCLGQSGGRGFGRRSSGVC
jgi:uncharacterized protein (TIGR02118 family)